MLHRLSQRIKPVTRTKKEIYFVYNEAKKCLIHRYKAFKQNKIIYLSEVAKLTDKQISQWTGIGKASVEEVCRNTDNYLKFQDTETLADEELQEKLEEELLVAVFGSVEENI